MFKLSQINQQNKPVKRAYVGRQENAINHKYERKTKVRKCKYKANILCEGQRSSKLHTKT